MWSLHRREQARDRRDIARILVGQDVRHDLASLCIVGQMQLAPSPWRAAMLLGIPVALPEHLQPGAAQHDMNGPVVRCGARLSSCEATAATAQRGMIRHGEIQPKQAQSRPCKAFGLT